MSVDPMADKYVGWSPYNYTLNNPITFVDPDGKEVVLGEETSRKFKKAFGKAVYHLNKNRSATMLMKLHASKATYTITESTEGSYYDPKTKTVYWNPKEGLLTNNAQIMSPTAVLNHEIDHALQSDINPEQQKKDGNTIDVQYENKEEKRVITGSEQETALNLGEIRKGEVTRTDHGGTLINVIGGPNSTELDIITVEAEKTEK